MLHSDKVLPVQTRPLFATRVPERGDLVEKQVRVTMPGACDCHMHVYDPAFPSSGALPPRSGRLTDYVRVRERLGLERVIVVQPTAYGTDNRCTLDAIRKLGPGARGIAVVGLDVTDGELQHLTDAGIRGQRYVMFPGRPLTWESMPAIAARVAPFGWHINLQLAGEELVQRESMLAKLPCS